MSKQREKLEEAIAHAKAVRSMAVAQAKVALTESLEPSLREDFSKIVSDSLQETDEEEDFEDMVSEVEGEEEDLDLDEILAEMEAEEETKEVSEAKDEDEDGEKKEDKDEAEDEEGKEEEGNEEEDESIDLEDMTEEGLKELIADVIRDMDESGDEDTEDEEMDEMGDTVDTMDNMDEMETAEDEEINLDELLNELIGEEEEEEITENATADANYQKTGYAKFSKAAGDKGMYKKETVGKEYHKTGLKEENTKLRKVIKAKNSLLKETQNTVDSLSSDLDSLNLLNAKLLYTNKIFKAKNLNESQKVRVLSTFDKASNVSEVKLVYESLKGGLASRNTKIIKEHISSASSLATPPTKKPIVEVNNAYKRMQEIAFHNTKH